MPTSSSRLEGVKWCAGGQLGYILVHSGKPYLDLHDIFDPVGRGASTMDSQLTMIMSSLIMIIRPNDELD